MRFVAFNQVVFEQQRVFFRFHHHVANVANVRHEQLGFARLLFFVEVRTDASFQVFGLTHINYFSVFIEILVASRCFGQVQHNAFQVGFNFLFVVHHRMEWCLRIAPFEKSQSIPIV